MKSLCKIGFGLGDIIANDRSTGPTSWLATSSRPSTPGFWTPGTTIHSLFNAQMPFATLYSIIMAAYISTWIQYVMRPFLYT